MCRLKGLMPLAVAALLLWLSTAVAVANAGGAEMRVNAPDGAQAVGVPFEVTIQITRADAAWAGYNTNMAYDVSVLRINKVSPGGIANCGGGSSWANPSKEPTMRAACVFQGTQDVGITEVIEVQCLKDGRSELHLVTDREDAQQYTTLFDSDGANISTDLVDDQVTCGAGGPLATVAIPTNPPGGEVAGARGNTPSASQSGNQNAGPGGANSPQAGSGSNATVSSRLISIIVVGALAAAFAAVAVAMWRQRGASSRR